MWRAISVPSAAGLLALGKLNLYIQVEYLIQHTSKYRRKDNVPSHSCFAGIEHVASLLLFNEQTLQEEMDSVNNKTQVDLSIIARMLNNSSLNIHTLFSGIITTSPAQLKKILGSTHKRAGHAVRISVILLTVGHWRDPQMLEETKIVDEAPTAENRTVQLRRKKNSEYRTREYLLGEEVESLMKAAKARGRYGLRDATMILVAYNHGLRVCELTNLQWTMIDFKAGLLHVVRAKKGTPSTHNLSGAELRALRALQREKGAGRFVFMSERGAPVSDDGFRKMLERLSPEAGLSFKAHPHMLRHACGFRFANEGKNTRDLQLYLGHKNIQHTVRYTELSARVFDGWLKD
jgi:type 1 fimbriae regulatory protein FimB/type 1 fimbriae regulatory protein FimE